MKQVSQTRVAHSVHSLAIAILVAWQTAALFGWGGRLRKRACQELQYQTCLFRLMPPLLSLRNVLSHRYTLPPSRRLPTTLEQKAGEA